MGKRTGRPNGRPRKPRPSNLFPDAPALDEILVERCIENERGRGATIFVAQLTDPKAFPQTLTELQNTYGPGEWLLTPSAKGRAISRPRRICFADATGAVPRTVGEPKKTEGAGPNVQDFLRVMQENNQQVSAVHREANTCIIGAMKEGHATTTAVLQQMAKDAKEDARHMMTWLSEMLGKIDERDSRKSEFQEFLAKERERLLTRLETLEKEAREGRERDLRKQTPADKLWEQGAQRMFQVVDRILPGGSSAPAGQLGPGTNGTPSTQGTSTPPEGHQVDILLGEDGLPTAIPPPEALRWNLLTMNMPMEQSDVAMWMKCYRAGRLLPAHMEVLTEYARRRGVTLPVG